MGFLETFMEKLKSALKSVIASFHSPPGSLNITYHVSCLKS